MPTQYDGRWGSLNSIDILAPGIEWIDGSSHGGFRLSRARLAEVPVDLRGESFSSDEYFEEDCSAVAIVLAFPQFFTPEKVVLAASLLKGIRASRMNRQAMKVGA
jgi:hypothetical protein